MITHQLGRHAIKPIQTLFRRDKSYDVVIAGGGSGGISVAARLAKKLGKGKVAIIEPSSKHFYQPIWTLVGAGAKTLKSSMKDTAEVIPQNSTWIQNRVASFEPENNTLKLENNDEINYKYLVVSLGLQLRFDKIKGLQEALQTPSVGSNYSVDTVEGTFTAMKNFKKGNAIFTFPPPPLKCPGAPQKIMYLTEEYLKKTGKREDANIIFNSAGPSIFAVKKYADVLSEVVKERNLTTNFGTNLVEVKGDCKQAVFNKVGTDEMISYDYEMLHVTPPMQPPSCLNNSSLTDDAGFVAVDKTTLQSTKYSNVFALGDCSSVPTSKTAAAVASQNAILSENLLRCINGEQPLPKYDGYTSCPLITGYKSCILAEFDFDLSPLETFPVNQGKERRSMYHLKADAMPVIYWNFMLKGLWSGPKSYRKMMHLGMSK